MNTQKQVLIMAALLMMMLIAVGIYAAWYPSRATDAEEHFEEARAERGSILFARNCRLCHGNLGEGGALGARLPAAPALDRPDLQGFETTDATVGEEVNLTATTIEVAAGEETTVPDEIAVDDVILIDEERMLVTGVGDTSIDVERGYEDTEVSGHFPGATIWSFDQTVLDDNISLITNTITCGRVGTAMPAWAKSQNGPLSDEQIAQLMTLITTGRWDLVAHEIDIEDVISSELTAPLSMETQTIEEDGTEIIVSEMMVSDITRFNDEEALRIGDERVRVKEIPEYETGQTNIPGTLLVERGALGTFAQEHDVDTEIFRFPETAEPSINESACGQTAQAAAPTGPCEEVDGVFQISAENIAFNCDEIEVDAGAEVSVAFTNLEATPHNTAFYETEAAETPITDTSVGPVFAGPDVTETITFTAPSEAGEYFFRCDVHPVQMTGTFIVN